MYLPALGRVPVGRRGGPGRDGLGVSLREDSLLAPAVVALWRAGSHEETVRGGREG